MDQFSTMLHLGGYGAYVWPAYGVAAVILIGLLWRTLASLRANERLAARLQNPGADMRTSPAGAPASAARHEAAR